MRVFVVNRYFAPDVSATSQLASDLAHSLARQGFEVHVLTGNHTYGSGKDLPPEETIDGVRVHRVGGGNGNANLALRAVSYATLHGSLYARALKLVEPGDVVIAKTDPPLLCVPMAAAARKRRAHLINWLQDLYPEVASGLGVPFMRGPSGALLSRLRDNALKQAAANVVISDGMGAVLAERTIPDQTIKVIHNWTNDETIQPLEPSANVLRAKWGLRGYFVVGYSGNLGRAHEIEPVLGAARILKQRKDIRFLFIGGGHLVRSLQQRAAADGTGEMFEFRPHQDREQLSMSLTAADVHLVSLRPEVEGLVFPSKFYGIAAAGRPVVAVADPRSEIAGIVTRERCGLVVRPGDGEGLAAAICELQANREQREALGRQGRALLDRRYSRAHALRLWSSLVAEVAAS